MDRGAGDLLCGGAANRAGVQRSGGAEEQRSRQSSGGEQLTIDN